MFKLKRFTCLYHRTIITPSVVISGGEQDGKYKAIGGGDRCSDSSRRSVTDSLRLRNLQSRTTALPATLEQSERGDDGQPIRLGLPQSTQITISRAHRTVWSWYGYDGRMGQRSYRYDGWIVEW